jgi:nucleoside-diphosphate-sugar epimerase
MLALAERGVRTSIVRLAPSVHGEGDHGFVPLLIATARRKGVAAYVGDGASRWPGVHRLDAARLFRLALEQAPAGTRLHAVADEGVPTRDIAGAIGRGLGLPVVAKSHDEAGEHFGFLGPLLAIDAPASSAITRERFGWRPVGPGLLADLDGAHYFATVTRAPGA